MKVQWTTDYHGVGNSFGYAVHNDRARDALVEAGAALADDADVAVAVAPAHRFFPVKGKRNILYTAWEAEQFPECFVDLMGPADAICVPSSYLKPALERILPGKPVYVVPLGVDAEAFSFVDRTEARYRPAWLPRYRRDKRPFRFLWLGAPNARKGFKHVLEAWRAFTAIGELRSACELYLKTSVPPGTGKGVVRQGNVIYDDRRLPVDELVNLYHRAHAFVFPSVGEGFGLTAAEAMATGLPLIYPPGSSLVDLCPPDRKMGYPVKFRWVPQCWDWTGPDIPGGRMAVDVQVHSADTEDLARTMIGVVQSWNEAFQVGKMGSSWIRQQFTWQRCGRLLLDVVHQVAGVRPNDERMHDGENPSIAGSERSGHGSAGAVAFSGDGNPRSESAVADAA